MAVDEPTLPDIQRRLGVIEHELGDLSAARPANGAEITLAYRKVQEAILYVTKAQEEQKRQEA